MPKQQYTFLDVATQWIITLALFLVCLALFWWIVEVREIKEKIKVESEKSDKRDATLEAIREKVGEDVWQRNAQRLQQNLQKAN
jgi:cell division septal protein FtsQ